MSLKFDKNPKITMDRYKKVIFLSYVMASLELFYV